MKNSLLILVFIVLHTCLLKAQMVGTDAYLRGTSVEIGIDGSGGFEGVDTTVSPPFSGMHMRSGTQYFGFVANPQLNGWLGSAYDGDFFTPGSAENGWGFEIGTSGGPSGSNNCALLGADDIPGALSFSTPFSCTTADWEGDYTSATDLHFRISYQLEQTNLYYTTSISITNNTSAVIHDIYYYRNLDPDNNETVFNTYSTDNTIVTQSTPGGCPVAHVSATQTDNSFSPPWVSYLGLAAVGANWRACYGGFANRDASDLWNGVGFTQTAGSTVNADEAIALAYKIDSLLPGATETFKFVTILGDTAASNAINNLLYFNYPGSLTAPPAACTPYTDTARTCGAPVTVGVNGSIASSYNWSWTPTTGLSSSTGSLVTANPPTTTTYTLTGTPFYSCLPTTTMSIVVQVTPATGNNPYITPVPVLCSSNPPFNLVVDSLGGIWGGTGIINDSTGMFDPAVAGIGTHLITYTTPGYCNTTDTVLITVASSASATITAPSMLCDGSGPVTLTAASPGGVWSGTGITDPNAGTFNPTTAGPGSYVITYSISGSCVAVDTATIVVASTTTPITGFSYPTSPICAADTITHPSTVAGFTTGGMFSSSPVGLSINSATGYITPGSSTPGTYTLTYAIPASTCGPAGSSSTTVTITSSSANITAPSILCDGTPPVTLTGNPGGGVWAGAGITDSIAGTFDPSVAGPGTYAISYTIGGSCVATDTASIVVGAVVTPVTGFSYPTSPICIADTVTRPLTVAGFASGGTFSSSPFGLAIGNSTGFITPGSSTPNTYTVTYTVPATSCGPAGSSTTTVTIKPLTPVTTGFSYSSAAVCKNDPDLSPTGVSGFTPGGTYSASPSTLVIDDSTGIINVSESTAGTYTITYSVPQIDSTCTAAGSSTTNLLINPLPVIGVPGDQILWIGENVTLIATGGISYLWTSSSELSCTACDTTVASPADSRTFCVTVTDTIGCIDSSCVKVFVEIPCPTNRNLEVPNAFTPNGDGYNDELCLHGWDDCVDNFLIVIYDRWGEMVYQSTDPNFCWNGIYKGELLNSGVFMYFIKAEYTSSGDRPLSAKGKVVVSRKGNISIVH